MTSGSSQRASDPPLADGIDGSGQDGMRLVFLGAALVCSMAILWFVTGSLLLVGGLLAGTLLAAALIHFATSLRRVETEEDGLPPDWSVTRLAADQAEVALAICDRAGRLVCANQRFSDWFAGMRAPPAIAVDEKSQAALGELARLAWRDGSAADRQIGSGSGRYSVRVERGGTSDKYLVWIFAPLRQADLSEDTRAHVTGSLGRALSRAHVSAVSIDADGTIVAANAMFADRATGDPNSQLAGRELAAFMAADDEGNFYFARAGARSIPVRLIHIPLRRQDDEQEDGGDPPSLFYIVDEQRAGGQSDMRKLVENLVANLPIGLALVDRDGRFLYANEAFRTAAGIMDKLPRYPGDLVVKEDKGPFADTIRRFANGNQLSGDIAVRLTGSPDEVVSFSVAGMRGVGEAAILLSLADTREESELKSQMAQVTKMQAVGQLAGGVAHDFNNILTAILGLCDLMLLRHSPGDSDYDDVQQVKNNANRAANLTRQLLAFSRQQTLRPQIVQLADIVSDTSSMLKRIMSEKVDLELRHGRGIGAVRADPGQLGQVITNLAVNARDAMPGGGTVLIETGAVSASDVRKMGREFMPVADYARLSVSDTGTGIKPEILHKIFDPFFTTKPMGKGTGLGLSTVYGIVKQSGGFIFADSEMGRGTRFDIYLPVHRGQVQTIEGAAGKEEIESADEDWGSGTVLLVEDEDMVRAVAERALTRQGYKVETAIDGEEAVELLKQGRDYDLILSDVVMPNMDGPAMAREARQMRPDIKILFMSGYAEEQLRKTIDIDNVGFLPKPFTVQQIARAVTRMLKG